MLHHQIYCQIASFSCPPANLYELLTFQAFPFHTHSDQCHPGTCTFVSHSSRNKPSPGFWACEPVVSLPRCPFPRKAGTLRQTGGRWFPTICSKCVEPSVIKNRKAYVPLLPGALFSLLGYFQELHFSLCGWWGRAWGPSGSVLKWQRGRGCCAHLLWTQVAATLLMGPRALVTSQICRPGLRKCSPLTPSEELENPHFDHPLLFFNPFFSCPVHLILNKRVGCFRFPAIYDCTKTVLHCLIRQTGVCYFNVLSYS